MVRSLLNRVERLYGGNALHLLALLCSFALVGYAAYHTMLASPHWLLILTWFVGALIFHDLLLFPLYAIADRSLVAALRAVRHRHPTRSFSVPPLNYIRTPVLGAALTFLLFFPGILSRGESTYHRATGLTQQPFLGRWLLLCAALFGSSALCYAIRVGRSAYTRRAK